MIFLKYSTFEDMKRRLPSSALEGDVWESVVIKVYNTESEREEYLQDSLPIVQWKYAESTWQPITQLCICLKGQNDET